MKSVLISIQPYWVYLIIAKIIGWDIGKEKTIEVRKNFPQNNDWCRRTVIYCSKDKKSFNLIPKEYQPFMAKFLGKVIGEFVCDKILKYECSSEGFGELATTCGTCLTYDEIINYCNGQDLYGWHISNLKIYDKPKELSEFWTVKCTNKKGGCIDCEVKPNCIKTITKPPQSWCYIEGENL